jgi:hypothetical protein
MHLRPLAVAAALALAAPAATLAASIHGTARADRVNGTARDDRIEVVGGGVDTVKCGRGADTVNADLSDRVAKDCELVTRRISVDTVAGGGGEHQTEVEPAAFGWERTVVATFQVGRFSDGGATAIGWSQSPDGGKTWRSGILPGITTASGGEAPRASDPAVAYDADHATWLVSTLIIGNAFTEVGISRSPDGATWSPPVAAARTNGPGLAYDKEWVGCDNIASSPFYGSCYLVWTDEILGRIASQTSRDGGVTWSAPVTVAAQFGANAEGALPLVQPDGALVVVFNGNDAGIYVSESVDGGATYTTPLAIADLQQAVQIDLRTPSLPAAAVDANGRIYVVWADCRFRIRCTGDDVVLTTSLDGTIWTKPTKIPGAGFDSFVPGIAADPASPGHVSVVTYVRTSQTCSGAGCSYGVATTSSRDGGLTWTTPRRLDAFPVRYDWIALTDGGRFTGDYAGAAYADGRFVPVFALAQAPAGRTLHEYMAAASIAG